MIEIVISLVLLTLILLLTWNYLTTNIIILIALITCFLIGYRLIKSLSEKNQTNPQNKKTYKDFVLYEDHSKVYKGQDNLLNQYELERVLAHEYKSHTKLKLFDGHTNKDIIEKSYSKSKPVYKYKQPYVLTDVIIQLQSINNENHVLIYSHLDDQDLLLYTIVGQEAQEIFDNYGDITSYALRITGGNKKYTSITNNGVIVIKKDSEPYHVEFLIHYNDMEKNNA